MSEPYPTTPSGETLRTYRIGYTDKAFGAIDMVAEPVVVGPFPIDLANYYLDDAFARLKAMPSYGNATERRWAIGMTDVNPSGDFPEGATVNYPCIMTPFKPIQTANKLAGEIVDNLKQAPGWGGGGGP